MTLNCQQLNSSRKQILRQLMHLVMYGCCKPTLQLRHHMQIALASWPIVPLCTTQTQPSLQYP